MGFVRAVTHKPMSSIVQGNGSQACPQVTLYGSGICFIPNMLLVGPTALTFWDSELEGYKVKNH